MDPVAGRERFGIFIFATVKSLTDILY